MFALRKIRRTNWTNFRNIYGHFKNVLSYIRAPAIHFSFISFFPFIFFARPHMISIYPIKGTNNCQFYKILCIFLISFRIVLAERGWIVARNAVACEIRRSEPCFFVWFSDSHTVREIMCVLFLYFILHFNVFLGKYRTLQESKKRDDRP